LITVLAGLGAALGRDDIIDAITNFQNLIFGIAQV
jgi:hypothetical protein